MIEAESRVSTPRTSASGIIHLIPCKPDDTSLVRSALTATCMLAAADACDPDSPLAHQYLDLADRALRRLAVLVDQRTHVSSIERIMIGRVADRILRPIEETGIIALDSAEELFLTALRDFLIRSEVQ